MGDYLVEFRRIMRRLHYLTDGDWVELPSWAQFYLEVGAAFCTVDRSSNRYVVAIAAPTRAFAAALISSGFVCARAISRAGDESRKHLDEIMALEPGSPLILRSGGRKLKGRFIEVRKFTGPEYIGGLRIGVQVEKGTQIWVGADEARRIEIMDVNAVSLPERQKGHRIEPAGPLLETIFDGPAVDAFLTRAYMECVLIGPTAGILESEITNEEFAAKSEMGDIAKGTLQDLLRVRRYLRRGDAYRAEVLPAGSRHIPKFAKLLEPCLVVFDGASGYMKWARYWQMPHHIVILDRTERNFFYAADLINQAYIERRLDRPFPYPLPTAPAGVEMMAFEVA